MNNVDMVANFFISIGMMENEDYMTNLKLQKLVYFAQALSLVKNKKALFEDEFEAWDLGPVIPSLYQKHKNGKEPITEVDKNFRLDEFSQEDLDVLLNTMAIYGSYSAHKLVEMTHVDGGPWCNARKQGIPIINKSDIEKFYSQKMALKSLDEIIKEIPDIGYRDENGTLVLPNDWNDE